MPRWTGAPSFGASVIPYAAAMARAGRTSWRRDAPTTIDGARLTSRFGMRDQGLAGAGLAAGDQLILSRLDIMADGMPAAAAP